MPFVAFVISLFALDYVARLRLGNVIRTHQFRLYALRDELRELAMCEQVKPDNWVFQYLDSSIAKTIRVLPHLSLWRAWFIIVFSKPDPGLKARSHQLHLAFAKAENKRLE